MFGPQIASSDFTGGGKLDLLVLAPNNSGSAASSQLAVLPGDGKGNLGAALSSAINFTPEMVVEADMNGDGKPDAVVAGNAKLGVLINQGTGTFAGEQDYTLPGAPISLAVGDFNGDGRMDVAVGLASPGGVYDAAGSGQWQARRTPVQIDASLNPYGLLAGSLTTDGRTDLIVADQGVLGSVNGALHVYLGNARTAPLPPRPGSTTTATNYTVRRQPWGT